MSNIKYKSNGEYKDIVVKVGDTLPIGTEVDYEGESVPNGWQQVENVLWENISPTTAIENGTEFSLSSSDYDYCSIIYNLSTSGTNISFNTEKIPKGQGTVLSIITSGSSNFNGLQRNINYISDTKLTSGVPYSFNNSSRSIDNTVLIPIKIIGYKKQIKKIAPVTPANGNIENAYGTSQENTYSQEYINKVTDYSTTEQVIGKWINGKPIYRKVVTINKADITAQTVSVAHGISNIGVVVRKDFIWERSNIQFRDLPAVYFGGNNWGGQMYLTATEITFELGTTLQDQINQNALYCYAIIEYTKTTD